MFYRASSFVVMFLLSLSFAQRVSAQDYYWQIFAQGQSFSSASPRGACDQYLSFLDSYSPKWKHSIKEMEKLSDSRFRCVFQYNGKEGTDVAGVYGTDSIHVDRAGDSCPPGTESNSQTGECEGPSLPGGEKCGEEVIAGVTIPKITTASGDCVPFFDADKPSQCEHLSQSTRTTSIYVEYDGDGKPIPPPPIVERGCVGNVIDVSHCKAPAPRAAGGVSLGPAPQQCKVGVVFTGEVADGAAPEFNPAPVAPDVCPEGVDCDVEDPPVVTDNQPCTYTQDAEGRMVCSSHDYKGVPGESSNCGTVNGEWQCIAKKPPTSTGSKIDTAVKTTQNPDGTTTTTKTDIRTDVNCTGVNACQSITTKTTNVTIKDGNGNTVSSETSCTGPKCGTGSPGKGDGKGDGACIVDCDEGEGAVSGPELGSAPGYGDSMQTFMSAVQGSPIMSAISGIGLNGAGSCNMGSASTAIGTISLDYICNNSHWLDPLYFVFLAIWALAAVRVLLSA